MICRSLFFVFFMLPAAWANAYTIQNAELRQESNGLAFKLKPKRHGKPLVKGEIPASDKEPRRLYFDIADAQLGKSIQPLFLVNQMGIYRIRLGQYARHTVRVVVEVEPTFQLPVRLEEYADGVGLFFGTRASVIDKAATSPKQPSSSLKCIVIDPGHGGHDPGAISKKGVKEKDITLSIARYLRTAMQKQMPAVRVLLTREGDQSLSLPERTQFANVHEADLFISIHVNSSPNPKTKGMETYYLNIAHDKYAIRLAARENQMSETEVSNLKFILADLMMQSNVQESIQLGNVVQQAAVKHLKSGFDVKDLGLKHALFYVLLGAKMPAILVETAFLSNPDEERYIKNPHYQKTMAEGLAVGIHQFVNQRVASSVP